MDYRHSVYDDPWGYQNKEELLIFGYSCKLFRDDEKALSLENGEHLIPWMGDSNLMIDRFDVRGTLYDLSEAEAKENSSQTLTEAEQKEEEICDEERYLALYHDETQEQAAYEEESKRLQVELSADGSYYNQIGFSYANPQYDYSQVEDQGDQKQVITSEPVSYNPTSDEDVFFPSPEMNIPPDMEVPKTVKQNKIIIKTAKFIVTQGAQMEIVIKTKQAGNVMFSFLAFDHPLNSYYKYVVSLIRNGRYRWEDEADSQTSPDGNSQYLHPNLSQSVRPDLTPGAVASPSRPSPHCSYSKLITKIREKQKASVVMEDSETLSPAAPSSPAVVVASSGTTDSKTNSTLRNGTSSDRVVSLVDYPSFNQTADGSDIEDITPAFAKKSPKGSSHDYSNIKWPPREIQMVIDKMASYIIKNGPAFEEIVKSRYDSRFEFLNKTHEFHPYYKCKIELYSEVYGDIFKNLNKNQQDVKKKNQSTSSRKNSIDQASKNGGSRTISFSIKSREQEVSLTSHTTFPIESSTSEEDEEMSDGEKERRKLDREQRRQARKLKEEKERKEREDFLKKERLRKEKEEEEKKKEKERQAAEEEDSSGNEDLYDIFKYAQEMERDTKPKSKPKSKPKHKIKPKPKLESQEEPVLKQEERKKKAAAFLSKLKDTKEEAKPVYGPQMLPEFESSLLKSASQSPASSRTSSEREEREEKEEKEKSPVPLPASEPQKSPPPPKSPSPPGLTDMLLKNFEPIKPSSSREISKSPKRSKSSGKDSISLMSALNSGLNDYVKPKKDKKIIEEDEHSSKSRSRSHKKHSRQKSEESWSPSSKRDRKKRKRSRGSTHRRKKHMSRSRSRSRSRTRSKSHRSYHKKKKSSSSHREKEKSRKKKHRRHRTPSSVSTLPSSESTSPSNPATLPSESESDMDVQVIESDEKKSSRSSSIVSLPSVCSFSKTAETKKKSLDTVVEREEKDSPKGEGYTSPGDENSVSSTPSSQTLLQKSRPLFPALESSNSSEGGATEVDKRAHFNPNTSSAMAKIAQGLRAKLNALLEKENKME